MSRRSRVPVQWREPPRRHGRIESKEELAALLAAGERLEWIFCLGCGLAAIAAIMAAAIAWGDALLHWLGVPL